MKKNIINLKSSGIVFLVILIFSCGPSKQLVEKEQEKIILQNQNLVPITEEHLSDLAAIHKSGLLNSVQIYVDSFSFGRDLPDKVEVNTKTGAVTRKTNMQDIFVAKQNTKGLIKSINFTKKEIITFFKNPTNQEVKEILFKDLGSGFILYSPEQGDTIVSSKIIFPVSSGKNSAKIYLDLEKKAGKNFEKVLMGEKITPK